MYDFTATPPLSTGGTQLTMALPSFAETATLRGAEGTVRGITGAEAVELPLVPNTLTATAVNVYVVPLVRPTTVQLVPNVEQVTPPGDAVTTYLMIAEPPVDADEVQDTETCPLPKAVTRSVGADGLVNGVTTLLGRLARETPTVFVAVTVKL